MDVNKAVKLFLRLLTTGGLTASYIYAAHQLEYWTQLGAVDNMVGAAPLILLTGITAFLLALTWKRHKNAETSTIALSILSILWALLLIPAWTGNWYLPAPMPAPDGAAPDISVYAPFMENTQAATLPVEASLSLSQDLPVLDGAIALYPVYAAFVQAVYDKGSFVPDMALCTNTPNAYQRIIAGDCDIIFVAGPSHAQRQAAADTGSDLVLTPIAKEAFVFLIGKDNPINSMSNQQLKNIYSGKTAHWRTFGWPEGGKIIVFQRPEGSGSQTGLQGIMGGLPLQKPQPLPDGSLIGTGSMLRQVSVRWQGAQPAIGYSYRYFATVMFPNDEARLMTVNGVYPSNETIANGKYPFTDYFYAVTNGPPTGNVKRLIDWILSSEGQYLIEQTGYVSINRFENIVPNSAHDRFYFYYPSGSLPDTCYEILKSGDGYVLIKDKRDVFEIEAEALDGLHRIMAEHNMADWNGFDETAPRNKMTTANNRFELIMVRGGQTIFSARGDHAFPDGYEEAEAALLRFFNALGILFS